MARATFVLEVDWDNDGYYAYDDTKEIDDTRLLDDTYEFSDTDDGGSLMMDYVLGLGPGNEDVTEDLIEVEFRRGRDFASQLTGRANPGRLIATLLNLEGKYSSYYSLSPIYGSILPGRKVRLRTTAPNAATLWTGYLDRIKPAGDINGLPLARIEAYGPMERVAGKKLTSTKQTSATTGALIGAILDDVGWSASDRSIDTGQTTVPLWFEDNKEAINAIRDIEETELGFFYESEDGKLVFEDRHHRLKSPHTTSQQTFSDAAGAAMGYHGIEQEDPQEQIFNDVSVSVETYTTAGSPEVLWTLASETPTVAPGQSVVYWAEYPNTNKDSSTGAFVDSWDTPAVGTDITQTGVANGDIGVSVSKFANRMKMTITNNNATTPATLTLVQAQGTKVTRNTPVTVSSSDATSQAAYGERSYRLPAVWLQLTTVAQDYSDHVVSRYKDPVAQVLMQFNANTSDDYLTQALTRNISDRVTVVANGANTYMGINTDFFIEAITHRIRDAGFSHMVTFELSDASGDGGWWTLGISALGTDTKLAY